MSTKEPLWLITARDVVAQHRSTKESIAQVMTRLARSRKLGSHDRRNLSEAVYGFIRKQPWPPWFVQKIKKEYGPHAVTLEASLRTRATPVLAVDAQLGAIEDVQKQLVAENIQTRKSRLIDRALIVENEFSFSVLKGELKKNLWLMDEGSQIIAQSVSAGKDEQILDMCAGGGGKTRYLLQTGAEVIAADISEKRLLESLKREGVARAKHIIADGLSLPFAENTFDSILIDAPCSGTGTLRRNPDILARLTEEKLSEFVSLQKKLIKSAALCLKPGGRLIYATCSVLPDENRKVVSWVNKHVKDLWSLSLKECWGNSVLLELGESDNQIQLLPSKHGCDGFFIACFKKLG